MPQPAATKGGSRTMGIDAVIWWLALAAGVAILLVTAAVHLSPTPWMQVVASFITFFASIFLSFVVTRHYAQVTAREELGQLAEAAGSRIFLLSRQMQQLATELRDVEPNDEIAKAVGNAIAAQIDRLAAQADLSVEDLERMANVDLPLPAMRDEAQTRVEATTRIERISCPHCSANADIAISTAGGASRHGRCAECGRGFVVHRIPDGSLKVGHTEYFRIECPNPDCRNEIGMRPKEREWGIIIRNCFECFARVQYDLDERAVDSFAVEEPERVAPSDVEDAGEGQRSVPCPSCAYTLSLRGYVNSRGQEVMSCTRCTRLVLVEPADDGPRGRSRH